MKKKITESKKDFSEVLKPYTEEVKRHMSVLNEDFKGQVKIVAEQFEGLNKKLDSHTEMIAKVATDVEIVKTDIEFIKGGLRKKVDYDEFITLEKRVAAVESKIRR